MKVIMHLILFIALLFICSSAFPSIFVENYYQTYLLKTIDKKTQKDLSHCSATLLKYKNNCHLITNYHCLPQKSDYKIILTRTGFNTLKSSISGLRLGVKSFVSFREDAFFYLKHSDYYNIGQKKFMEDKSFEVKVKQNKNKEKQIDNLADLVELAIPSNSELKKIYCPILKNTTLPKNYQGLIKQLNATYLAAIGFVDKKPYIQYSSYLIWPNSLGRSEATFISSNLLHVKKLIKIKDLALFPGMSGGPVINWDGKLMGINTQFIPFQNKTVIIPIIDVINFINRKIKKRKAPLLSINNRKIYQAALFFNLNNRFKIVGDNEHAHGTDKYKMSYLKLKNDPLSFFREPQEGIWENCGQKHLLAINYKQIDGIDDYLNLNHFGKKIYRKGDGFPGYNIRSNLLNRLEGVYDHIIEDKTFPRNDFDFTYLEEPKSKFPWKLLYHGNSFTKITVTKEEIYFSIAEHSVTRVNTFKSISFPPMLIKFEIVFRPPYKYVYLKIKGKETPLRCVNNNYLKLICSNGVNVEFSLSLNNTEANKGKLNYRLAVMSYSNSYKRRVIYYYFGKLLKVK